MTINWKHVIAAAAVVLVIALCVGAYVSEHIDRIKAESAISAKEQIIAERDKATADLIEQLKDAAAKVTKPEQVPAALPQVIQLPAPVVQVPERVTSVTGVTPLTPLPEAASAKPGDLIIPKVDVVPLYQQLNSCKQNEAALATCHADLKDTISQRNAAITAVKGGSFFTRVKRNAKWLAIGSAIGAGAVAASRR